MKHKKIFVLVIILTYTLFSKNISQAEKLSENDHNIARNVNQLKVGSSNNNQTHNNNNDNLITKNFKLYLPVIANNYRSTQVLGFLYDRDIWTVDEDGTNLRRITNIGEVSGYSWSPDGKQFALLVTDFYNDSDVFTVNADGSNLNQLTYEKNAFPRDIDWHGSKIAFIRDVGNSYIRISYIQMNNPSHPIIDISPAILNYGKGLNPVIGTNLEWSPDGRWIVGDLVGIASSDGSQYIDDVSYNPHWKNDSSIFISPYSGIYFFNPNNLSSGYISQVEAHEAAYSSDDQYILYCDDYAIRRMKPNNTEHITLLYTKATKPVWDPGSDYIAFISWKYTNDYPGTELTGLHIIKSDGSNLIQILAGRADDPQWRP